MSKKEYNDTTNDIATNLTSVVLASTSEPEEVIHSELGKAKYSMTFEGCRAATQTWLDTLIQNEKIRKINYIFSFLKTKN